MVLHNFSVVKKDDLGCNDAIEQKDGNTGFQKGLKNLQNMEVELKLEY